MNSKKCKVLRRMARIEMTGYPECAYADQTVHPVKGKSFTGEEVFYPVTDPITLDLSIRKYYKFLKRTTANVLRRGMVRPLTTA